jgi:hypothetical protein
LASISSSDIFLKPIKVKEKMFLLLKSQGFKKKVKVEGRACYEGQLLAPAPALAPYG